MVFFFISDVVSPKYIIYMGAHKEENEELLKWGWPEDIWFHVDKLSSAHVYLRLQEGQTIEDIPKEVLEDCAQLVKFNSIEGNKKNNIDVVYTPYLNLKKTGDMVVGQVGFHKQKEVKTIKVEKRINEIVKRLNKTKEEKFPNLQEMKDDRDRKEREARKRDRQTQQAREKEEEKKKKEEAELRSYSSLMTSDKMTSNNDLGYDSDDFM